MSVSLKNSFTKAGSNWVWGMLRVFNFPLFSQLQLSLYLPPWLCGYCRERSELNWSSQLDHVQQQLRLWRKNWESAGQLSHRSRHSSQVAERREGGREGGRGLPLIGLTVVRGQQHDGVLPGVNRRLDPVLAGLPSVQSVQSVSVHLYTAALYRTDSLNLWRHWQWRESSVAILQNLQWTPTNLRQVKLERSATHCRFSTKQRMDEKTKTRKIDGAPFSVS